MQRLDSTDASLPTTKSEIENSSYAGCGIEDSISCDGSNIGSIFSGQIRKNSTEVHGKKTALNFLCITPFFHILMTTVRQFLYLTGAILFLESGSVTQRFTQMHLGYVFHRCQVCDSASDL